MKKRVLIPTLLIGALLTSSFAFAGFGFGGGSCGSGGCDGYNERGCNGRGQGAASYEQHQLRADRKIEMMSTVLDLSASQQEQLEALFEKQWQGNETLREKMQTVRDEMREARFAKPFNEADFRAKAAKQAEMKTDMLVEREKMRQEVYAILTPEQQEKAEKLGGLMGGRGKGRHGGKGFRF